MRFQKFKYILAAITILSMHPMTAQERTNPNNQSEELGKVSWYRDFDTAIKLSNNEDKPILILFQEVPGCMTCRNYGHNVLTHPLMVEAIENEFIPLAIYNNKDGKDKEILNLYNEPSWNNPVVRIVDSKGKDLTQRVAGNYSAKGLYKAMASVLDKENKVIPEYVRLLGQELLAANATEEAYYQMYCFWTGEKQLGGNRGVLNTEAGFMNGREVVKVTYDQQVIAKEQLSKFARQHSMTPKSKNSSYRQATKDEDYYLQHTNFKYLPLTELQRTKINSALGTGESGLKYLSPKQLNWLKDIKTSTAVKTTRYNKPFTSTWQSLSSL